MNIWKLLASHSGRINKAGLLGTAVMAGVLGIGMYNYTSTGPQARASKVRNLAQIINSGAALPQEYSGINLTTGGTQFATAEEIAQQERGIFDGGEGALAAMNANLVQGRVFSGGEAGLGMGANEAAFLGGQGGASGADQNATADAKSAAAAAALARARQAGAGQRGNTLARASMARAGGSDFGGTSYGGSFGSSARSEGANRVGASSISGSMPGGSTLLAVDDSMKGGRSAKYTNGYRDARAGYGAQSAEGKDLRDIAVHSGKVAANKDRSSNEGASPFLATKYFSGSLDPIGSGSEGLITDPSLQGIANDSFGDKMEIKLDDLDQKLDEVDTTEQERQAQEKRFTNWVSILAVASIGAMFAIAALKQEPPWGTVAAAAISAVMTGLWIWFDVALKKDYIDKFGSDAMSTIYFILSGLCLGGMMAAWVWGGFSNMLNQIAAWFAKVFHISLGGIGASSVLGAGVDGATKLAKKE